MTAGACSITAAKTTNEGVDASQRDACFTTDMYTVLSCAFPEASASIARKGVVGAWSRWLRDCGRGEERLDIACLRERGAQAREKLLIRLGVAIDVEHEHAGDRESRAN